MRGVAVTEPGEVRVVDLPKPAVGPYQALIRTEVAALCNATDGKLVGGHFPGVESYPLVLGHESAGVVEETGPKVRSFREGQRAIGGLVFDLPEGYASGWGGFCEYTVVNDHDAMVADGVADPGHGWLECYEIQRPVPGDIGPEDAVLLCTWREVLGTFEDFRLRADDRILVFGCGPVGLSFVRFARARGARWIGAVDPLEPKRRRAIAFGASAVYSPEDDELRELRDLDAVIDAVGSEGVVNAALPLIRMGGSICVYGVIGAPRIDLAKHAAPYNFNLLVHQWPTRAHERAAQEPLCDWIRRGDLSYEEYVTHEFPVEEIGSALAAVQGGEAVKCLLRYQG